MTEQKAFYTSVMLYFIVSFLWMNKNVLEKKKEQERVSDSEITVLQNVFTLYFSAQHKDIKWRTNNRLVITSPSGLTSPVQTICW